MPLPSLPTLPQNNGVQGPQSGATPAPIHVARYARNGLLPHAVFETELGNSLAFAARIRVKSLLSWFVPFADIPSDSGSTRTRWRAAAHTSPMCRRLRAVVYLAQQDSADATEAGCAVYATNADASTTYGSGTYQFGTSSTGTTNADVPSEFSIGEIVISAPADTDIFLRVDDTGKGRLISCTIYEEGLPIWTGNGYPQSQVAVTSPILDDRRAAMLQLATNLWKRGAAHLWNWSRDLQSSPLTVVATTLNVIDGTSSTVSAATPGATIDLRYCRTRSVSTVPCVFAAWASMSAGSGEILLKDSGGNTLATLTINSSTAAWYTTTVDLPAALAKYDVLASNAAAGTLSVGAFSLYQYA